MKGKTMLFFFPPLNPNQWHNSKLQKKILMLKGKIL